jgi:hypothetical protein
LRARHRAIRSRTHGGARGARALGGVLLLVAALHGPTATPPARAATDGRAIYRITPARHQVLFPLQALGLDVAGTGPGGTIDVILSPGEVLRVRALGFEPRPLDLAPRGVHGAAESPLLRPDLGDYHTVDEADQELAAYAAAHPLLTRLVTIGTSIEGRPIRALKISDNAAMDESEPRVLVVGCHHARELMSVELPLYLMRRLLDAYGTDPVLTQLVDTREVWIVPVLNPDGHVYVENHSGGQSDGWWRKNRRANNDGSFGVDLNRNYGYEWGHDNYGSSPTPASEVYRGMWPFSEPETAAFRDFMAAQAFSLCVSFHSYGELVLYPWGYVPADTPDHAVYKALGDSVAAMNGYLAGNNRSGAIYATNGDMSDWAYGETGLKPAAYSFTFELNTAEQGGFGPPDNLIGPTCELNWGPLLTLLTYADGPRRILGPARPSGAAIVVGDGAARLEWAYTDPDTSNPPARHDVRKIASYTIGPDGAEAGLGNWDAARFTVSSARSSGGTSSFYSGAGNGWSAVLAMRAPLHVSSTADSVVVQAWWALEAFYDYWYAEASADGGATWSSLPGTRTTDDDPFQRNLGNGMTGASGAFLRCAFTLKDFVGSEVLVRFRALSDGAVNEEGLYLDDVETVASMAGLGTVDTGDPAPAWALDPVPGAPAWYQVRAVDAEGHAGLWSGMVGFDPAVTGAEAVRRQVPDRVEVQGANPTASGTTVRFTLAPGPAASYRLEVFDIQGRLVRVLARGRSGPGGGQGAVRWDGSTDDGTPVGSGVYVVRLATPRGRAVSRVTLLR